MHRRLALLLGLLPLVACKAGAAGNAVAPPPPTAGDALGELRCSEEQTRAEPLVVDWGSDDRTDLEVAMRDGVVVAAYDCNSFRVLDRCRARGAYGFAGVSRKEDVVQIAGRDELHANFPLGKAELAAVVDRGSTIDVALVTVGKQRTSAFQIMTSDLEGDCEGATHFVSSALVGAFSMASGTRGEVGTVAELFSVAEAGGSSTSERSSLNRDGDLEACKQSNPTDANPPAQCGSILRVELVELTDEPAMPPMGGGSPRPEPLPAVCPSGFVRQGGKCSPVAEAKAYRCAPDDTDACTAQCEAGSAESCHNLAMLTTDAAQSQALYQKACDGGHAPSCAAVAYRLDWKAEPARVVEMLAAACDGGDAQSCRVLGDELLRGKQLPADAAKGEAYLGRACSMAERFACSRLAWHQWKGNKDAKKGLEVAQADCARGNGSSCSLVGGWLSRCEDGRPPGFVPVDVKACKKYPKPDPGGATRAFEQSCRDGFVGACAVAAKRYRAGKGVSADMARVVELLEIGCPQGWHACSELGRIYESGDGVPADPAKALEAYAAGCKTQGKADCFDAARLAEASGDAALRKTHLEAGCKVDGKRSCDALTQLLEAEGKAEEAKTIYGDVCDRLKHEPYCDAFVRLGGTLPKGFKTFPRGKTSDPDQF